MRLALTALLVLWIPHLAAQNSTNPSLVGLLAEDGRFSILIKAAKAAGLAETLNESGPLTLFAPTDAAFRKSVDDDTLSSLLLPANKDKLIDILKLHVVSGAVFAAEGLERGGVISLLGETLSFGLPNGRLTVRDITFSSTDRGASNGILHVIDRVLMPTQKMPVQESAIALVERAVEIGAPLYNNGNELACASIYAITVQALLVYEENLSEKTMATLRRVRNQRESESSADWAWRLREGLDASWRDLSTKGETVKAQESAAPMKATSEADSLAANAQTPAEREAAIRAVKQSLQDIPDGASEERMRRALSNAAEVLSPDSHLRLRLETASKMSANRMGQALKSLRKDLAFKPLIEAKLPVGFPDPTPAGEIQIKVYPEYRMAQTSMGKRRRGNSNSSFFKLFGHIKKNDIPMTAPVQNDYREDGASSMAFLYEKPELGPTGKDGDVQIIDIPSTTVLSMGIRGPLTKAKTEAARKALQAWIAQRSDRFEATGGWRTMGYNSPFVPANRRFSEIQIPIIRSGSAY